MTSTFDITDIMEQNTNYARCLKKKNQYIITKFTTNFMTSVNLKTDIDQYCPISNY